MLASVSFVFRIFFHVLFISCSLYLYFILLQKFDNELMYTNVKVHQNLKKCFNYLYLGANIVAKGSEN